MVFGSWSIGRDTSYSDWGFLLFSSAPPGECVCDWFRPGTAFFTIQYWFVKSCLLVCYSVVLSIAKIKDRLNLCVLLQKSLLHPKTVH